MRAIVALVDGNVMAVPSVPASVKLLLNVSVFPAPPVSVHVPAVNVFPLIVVAVAVPSTGDTSVGTLESTTVEPVPVVAKFPSTPALLYKM